MVLFFLCAYEAYSEILLATTSSQMANYPFATSLPYQREVWRDCKYESSKRQLVYSYFSWKQAQKKEN